MFNPTDRLIKYDCDATDGYLIYLMEALEADDIPTFPMCEQLVIVAGTHS